MACADSFQPSRDSTAHSLTMQCRRLASEDHDRKASQSAQTKRCGLRLHILRVAPAKNSLGKIFLFCVASVRSISLAAHLRMLSSCRRLSRSASSASGPPRGMASRRWWSTRRRSSGCLWHWWASRCSSSAGVSQTTQCRSASLFTRSCQSSSARLPYISCTQVLLTLGWAPCLVWPSSHLGFHSTGSGDGENRGLPSGATHFPRPRALAVIRDSQLLLMS